MARAFGAPRRNDGHTNLGWEGALCGFATHALPQGSVLCLDIRALTLKLSDDPAAGGQQAMSPDAASLPALPSVGHWHTHHFTAAVADDTRILAASYPQAAVDGFLRTAVGILVPD